MPNANNKRKSRLFGICVSTTSHQSSHTLRVGPNGMIQTDPIFLGVVPRGARSYVAREFVRLGKPLFNPCVGRFSIVEAVVKSGFPAAQVQASDIGLFSSLIGYLAANSKHLEDLGIRILDPGLEPRDLRDELDFAAHTMLIVKLNQLSQTNLRGLYLREELRASWSRYREAVREELAGLVATIKGIHYELADIWDIVERVNSEDASFFASVPHYAQGYEKMFSAPNLTWKEPSVQQFDPKAFPGLLQRLGEAQCAALLCRRGEREEQVPPPREKRWNILRRFGGSAVGGTQECARWRCICRGLPPAEAGVQDCTPGGPCPFSKGVRQSWRRATVVDERKRGHCRRLPLSPGFLSTGRNETSRNDIAYPRRIWPVGQRLR